MSKRTLEGESLTELILETFRLNGALLLAGNHLTKPYGLTSARWQVMGAIDIASQPLTVSQVARRMGLTRQAVQRVVNDLVHLKMVALMPNLDHKRAQVILITKSGETVMLQIDKAQIELANNLSKGLKISQLKQALNILQNISEATEQLNQNFQEK